MKKLDFEAARAVAFRFLSASARTRFEINQRLLRDEFPAEVIRQVMTELESLGYIDDAGFANRWIDDRAERKKYGRTRLASELQRKGIDRETATEALNAILDDDERRRAIQLARSRWSAQDLVLLDFPALQKEKVRISSFLARRGFGWQTIKKVLDELLANES